MLREDGFSYTNSELEDKRSASSSESGSSSDELSAGIVEENLVSAKKARKTLENRMHFFRNHMKFLNVEDKRVVDPQKANIIQNVEDSDVKTTSSSASQRHATPLEKQSGYADRPSSSTSLATMKSNKFMQMSSAESSAEVGQDRVARLKALEEADLRFKKYHSIKMRKQSTVERLREFLAILEAKQQSKLFEEHNIHFRQFKYAGPSREGPLFCLREQFRRERKAWRVKYAKKYGLLCREFRLEKRLMRKAKRLIIKERILNALKDKSKSKVIILLEMRQEFKKLVEKLKLNKEIQEKIRRQEKLYKAKTAVSGRRAGRLMRRATSQRRKTAAEPKFPLISNSEVQKGPPMAKQSAHDGSSSQTSLRRMPLELPPLPRVPKSSISSLSKKSSSISTADSISLRRKFRKDSVPMKSETQGRTRTHALKVDEKILGSASKALIPKQKIPVVARDKDNSKSSYDEGKCLKGKFVRLSEKYPLNSRKYKNEQPEFLELMAHAFRCEIADELRRIFSSQPEKFLNTLTQDLKKLTDFVFDHLDKLSEKDLETVLKNLAKLRDDPDIPTMYDCNYALNTGIAHADEFLLRKTINAKSKTLMEQLSFEFEKFRKMQKRRKDERRVTKSGKKTPKVKDESSEENRSPAKKSKRKTLADRLLLKRSYNFKNPVKVTTKLGGKFILKGWRHLTFEQYIALGSKLTIHQSGWRQDGMEQYEAIVPFDTCPDDIKYHLVLNRLDLTPRRFKFAGYEFMPKAFQLMNYCSGFYRLYLLKRDERVAGQARRTSNTGRNYVAVELLPGELRVPHLAHLIIKGLDRSKRAWKPTDRNTPEMFCRRTEEIEEFEEFDVKELRIRLQETKTLDLWSFLSVVAVKGTEEAEVYKSDRRRNKQTKARFRRTFPKATQTEIVHYLNRSTQLSAPNRDSKKTNVYEYDLIEASREQSEPKLEKIRLPGFQEEDTDSTSESSLSSTEAFNEESTSVLTSREFLSKMAMTARIVGSMAHSKNQLTFNRGLPLDPLDPEAHVLYSHERLFSFIDKRIALSEFMVTCLDWSSFNPNLLCVGYTRHPLYPEQDRGLVCIWNVKQPLRYERKFEFQSGVTFAQFCKPYPRLLNIALVDGSIMILDLVAKKRTIVMTKSNSLFSDYLPVWNFSWFELDRGYHVPVACGDNGYIYQLRPDGTFQHSVFLSLGHREGIIKGIKQSTSMGYKPRIRSRPGITCLQKHPTNPVLYLVGTTDGCVHICSIHFRNQHLDVFSAHVGCVKGIQFHPHCKDVFLTYGDDFYVRVWLYGKFEPALELMAGNSYVRAAQWSPVNPEILVSISNKYVDVWDVRRKTDSPIHIFKNPRMLENTVLAFDWTGKNLALGNIGGDVYVYTLKDMPFSHHFKGEAISSSLEKVLKAKKQFAHDLKRISCRQ